MRLIYRLAILLLLAQSGPGFSDPPRSKDDARGGPDNGSRGHLPTRLYEDSAPHLGRSQGGDLPRIWNRPAKRAVRDRSSHPALPWRRRCCCQLVAAGLRYDALECEQEGRTGSPRLSACLRRELPDRAAAARDRYGLDCCIREIRRRSLARSSGWLDGLRPGL